MTKKAPSLADIVTQLQSSLEQEKTASAQTVADDAVINLLQKVASELKTYNSEVTYDELTQFIKGTK